MNILASNYYTQETSAEAEVFLMLPATSVGILKKILCVREHPSGNGGEVYKRSTCDVI